MKKAIIAGAFALALGITGVSYAQSQNQTTPPAGGPGWGGHCWGGGPGWGGPGPGWHHGGRGRGMGPGWGMAADLNLNQKQQEQIQSIMDKQRTDTEKQVRSVLNTDQRKIYDQRQAQRDAWRQQWQQRMQQQAPNQ